MYNLKNYVDMNIIDNLFEKVFSKTIQKKFEKFILILAASGFLIHLLLIFLNTYGFINDFFSGFEIDNIQDLNLMEAIFLKNGPPF